MKLSSYNIKCLVIYILYCLFFFFIGEGTFFDDDIKNYVFQYIGIPLITYLLLPFVLKLIGDWKIVRWIDGAIDYVYRSIKEPGKQHAFHIEKSTLSSDDTTTKKSHWIWKVLMFYIVVALMGDALTSCGSERHESRSSALSLSDASFFGDSTAVFIAKDLQNGYQISIIHNKQIDLIHFERGDSISQYCAIHKLPFDLRYYEEDSIGVFNVNIDIPVSQLDTLGGSKETPDMFFMDVNFDGEEEFVVKHDGYNRYYYACFDLVKGNRHNSCPGILESNSEPPYNNIVSGIVEQPSYTVFDRKKKEIYIHETMGCCSFYETWVRYFEGDQYGNEPEVKIVKKVDHEWWADGTEHVTTYKLINDSLKLVEKKNVE